MFSFSFSLPRPVLLHISNGLRTPQFIPTFHAETTHQIHVGEYFEGHVDHCRSDMWYNVHSHYNVHTIYFQWSTQTLSCWPHNFPLTKSYYTKFHGNIQGAFNFMLFTPTAICTLLIFHGPPKILSRWAPIMSHWAHNLPLSATMISYWDKIHYTKSHGNIQEAFKFILFTPTAICTPLISHGTPKILSHWAHQ